MRRGWVQVHIQSGIGRRRTLKGWEFFSVHTFRLTATETMGQTAFSFVRPPYLGWDPRFCLHCSQTDRMSLQGSSEWTMCCGKFDPHLQQPAQKRRRQTDWGNKNELIRSPRSLNFKRIQLYPPNQSDHADERKQKPFPSDGVISGEAITLAMRPSVKEASSSTYFGFMGSCWSSQPTIPWSRSVIGCCSLFATLGTWVIC